METRTLPLFLPDRDAFEISPALEESGTMPVSTHWIPLHELIAYWTAVDTLLLPAPVAPLLTAIGHALFALSRETRALRRYTLAWQKQHGHVPQMETESRSHRVVRHLHEAAHHWSRAACSLESLLPTDLDSLTLARARRLSRIARTQQARLWALIEEIRADGETWHAQPEQEVH
jgi:hypothetical protein